MSYRYEPRYRCCDCCGGDCVGGDELHDEPCETCSDHVE
jgi:hypothetical protein